MQSDDDKRCANRLRANAEKLMFFANEMTMWLPGDDYTKRREQMRRALENTRQELFELCDALAPLAPPSPPPALPPFTAEEERRIDALLRKAVRTPPDGELTSTFRVAFLFNERLSDEDEQLFRRYMARTYPW